MLGLPSRLVFCATLLGALSCGPEAFEPEGLPSGGLESEGPVTGTQASALATAQKVAIPSYFNPVDGPWRQLRHGAPAVGLAIINPASGPGTVLDSGYREVTRKSQARGVLVLGYVHTSYGKRSPSQVRAEIDRYYKWYGVDGIFLDEVSTDCRQLPYYRSLFDGLKATRGAQSKVVLNPGTNAPECYASASDILVNFESSYDAYVGWRPSGWEYRYPAHRFWHLVHGTAEAHVADALSLSQRRNAGWVYVTPDTLPNPWDTLPPEPYWSNQLGLLER